MALQWQAFATTAPAERHRATAAGKAVGKNVRCHCGKSHTRKTQREAGKTIGAERGDEQLATQQRQAAKHKQKTAKDSKTERERETARQTENTRTTCNPSPAKYKRAKEAKGRTKQRHSRTRRSAQRERLRDRLTARLGHVAPQKFDDSH